MCIIQLNTSAMNAGLHQKPVIFYFWGLILFGEWSPFFYSPLGYGWGTRVKQNPRNVEFPRV